MTTIPNLFDQWRRLVEGVNAPRNRSEEDNEADLMKIHALEDEIERMVPRSGADWACKVAIVGHYSAAGDGSTFRAAMLRQAQSAVGTSRGAMEINLIKVLMQIPEDRRQDAVRELTSLAHALIAARKAA